MSEKKNLNHHEVKLNHGGKIVVLDTGAVLTAEMTAMLQALHSRSTKGIKDHLKVLADRGSDKFMKTFYVGYGHKSIGDCGTTTVFIEGVSMLAAKAIQDSKLYNGQESSTRYIDFTKQPFVDPINNEMSKNIQEKWREFYLKVTAVMKTKLPNRYPLNKGEKPEIYQKAINARAFDIARGFLPAGTSTNLAWTTTLRQFDDRIMSLRHHPLSEVREIANKLNDALLSVYPSSFKENDESRITKYAATNEYIKNAYKKYYYHDSASPKMKLVRDNFDKKSLDEFKDLLATRPPKTELPKWLGAYGEATFAFTLDFGSFRDIQRHRAVTQRMPLLTAEIGFNDWYLNELTEDLRNEAKLLILELTSDTEKLTENVALRQYYLPMGLNISNYLRGDLPALIYLIELRANSLVHPTLATQATEMAKLLEENCNDISLKIHLSSEPGRFDVKRGEADIIKME